MINPLAISVEGIGFDPLSISTMGFSNFSIIIVPPSSETISGGGFVPDRTILIPGQITIIVKWDGIIYRNNFQHIIIDHIINIIIKIKKRTEVLIKKLYKNDQPKISVIIRNTKNDFS